MTVLVMALQATAILVGVPLLVLGVFTATDKLKEHRNRRRIAEIIERSKRRE